MVTPGAAGPTTRSVPYRLLRHHGAMAKIGARILLHTISRPFRRPASKGSGAAIAAISRVIPAPAEQLVEHYIAWSGAAGRYDEELPSHMLSQWSLPLISELMLRLPYRLTSVINQGVTMKVHGPLPRGEALAVSASVEWAEQAAGRVKVVVAIVTGTAREANLVEARLHLSFLLPGRHGAKPAPARPPEPQWMEAGQWRADTRDGLRFALLSGDFNPIHWCAPLARLSVFGGTVLHGFGSFVRSYEILRRTESEVFSEIDVRFLRPVPLPCSHLSVQTAPAGTADAEGWRALRLVGAAGTVHLAGRLR
jgi:acyl dehydratase